MVWTKMISPKSYHAIKYIWKTINFHLIFVLGDIIENDQNFSKQFDPRVTYDLIEGHLPPPGLSVIESREEDYSNKIR